jgi:hypothetical protein
VAQLFSLGDITMKIITSLLLIALLVSSNGCMTYDAIQHAKGQPAPYFAFGNDDVQKNIDGKPHPAYYAWLPLSIPADIATAPIQGIGLLIFAAGGGGAHQ